MSHLLVNRAFLWHLPESNVSPNSAVSTMCLHVNLSSFKLNCIARILSAEAKRPRGSRTKCTICKERQIHPYHQKLPGPKCKSLFNSRFFHRVKLYHFCLTLLICSIIYEVKGTLLYLVKSYLTFVSGNLLMTSIAASQSILMVLTTTASAEAQEDRV